MPLELEFGSKDEWNWMICGNFEKLLYLVPSLDKGGFE